MSSGDTGKSIATAAVVGILAFAGYKIWQQFAGGAGPVKIAVGQRPVLDFTWKNADPEASGMVIAPQFRFDLHPNFSLPRSWVEGEWVASAGIASRQTEKLRAVGVVIPGDWGGMALNVNAKLVARIEGILPEVIVWQRNDAYQVVG